jgi:nicotinic acid phosphoribosyltransferase
MTMNYRGKDGIREALHMLKNFYMMFKEEEMMKLNQTEIITTLDLNELKKMKANLPRREFIERSSVYVGYKLLWAIRLLLLGKKFPKGHFDLTSW